MTCANCKKHSWKGLIIRFLIVTCYLDNVRSFLTLVTCRWRKLAIKSSSYKRHRIFIYVDFHAVFQEYTTKYHWPHTHVGRNLNRNVKWNMSNNWAPLRRLVTILLHWSPAVPDCIVDGDSNACDHWQQPGLQFMTFFSAVARQVKFSAAAAEPGWGDTVDGLNKKSAASTKTFF
jgi:hypothetical protein